MSHHTTSPAEALPKAGYYDPQIIEDLEATIAAKIQQGQQLYAALADTHRQRLAGRAPQPPAWVLRQQIQNLQEDIELDLSDLDRRRI